MTSELGISRRKILAAIDLSESSLQILNEARLRVEQAGGTWAVCHVLPEDAARAVPTAEAVARQTAERLLEQASPEGRPELFLEQGGAAATIVRVARTWGADLIVMASHSHGALERVLLGSVAGSVVRHAHCAVLVLRRQPAAGSCVLAATDLSRPSLPAIQVAADEATRLGLPLKVAHAIDAGFGALNSYTSGMLGASAAAAPLIAERRELEIARTELAGQIDSLGVSATAVVLDGPARDAIVDCASSERAALVVVGTHGRTGLSRVLLGSVAESVVTRAACPVEVVRVQEGT